VFFSLNERVYADLPKKGIRFPFPQLSVHFADKEQK
jgi:small-conductance mechanosensitive channel